MIKENNVCYVIGAGEFERFSMTVYDGDCIIAADGGLKNCEKFSLSPDITVGDFDSLGYTPHGENIVVLPVEKDVTDMYKAINIGIGKGYTHFALFGGMGGRPDHSFANIAITAELSKKQIKCELYSDIYVITAVTDSEVRFSESEKGIVSVFSFTDISDGVNVKGLKYPLDNFTLKSGFPLGVSNEFTGLPSSVSVNKGTLIVMKERT